MENKKEIWKDIPGYEGLYQASTEGRIKSVYREKYMPNGVVSHIKERILTIRADGKNRGGKVALYKSKKRKDYNIHSLIALTFIGDRPESYDVCHKNGNPKDNRLTNLRYDSKSQNQIDSYRYGSKTSGGKLSILEVLFIRHLHKTGKYYHEDLAKMFNINRSSISSIIRRETFYWLNDDGSINESNTKVS